MFPLQRYRVEWFTVGWCYFFCGGTTEGLLKVGLSPSKKNCFICFNENPLKMMKKAFNFTLKALFVLKIFKCLF